TLHDLGELEVLHLAEEAEHVAALPAPEAVVDLLGRADGEGGRLLRMERTQPHQRVAPGLLELEEARHDLHDVRALPDGLDVLGSDPAGHLSALLPGVQTPTATSPGEGRAVRT